MNIPCPQTENQNNFRQGTLENDVWRKGGMGTTDYDEHRFSCPRSVKLSLIVQTTKYFQFLFRTI
jgi:hypothetical protein